MATAIEVNRREFLKTGATGGAALVLGFYLPPRASQSLAAQASGAEASGKIFKANAWIRITADNQITLLVEKPEMGQGPQTAVPIMLADELEADWTTIRVEQAPTIPEIYKGLSTGGSSAVEETWGTMRKVGAQAREMLLTAAAQQWGVDKKDCRAENGAVLHASSGRRVTYGELVVTASKLPEIKADTVPLKDPKDYRYIGKQVARTDVPAKVDGSAEFGIDVRVPGMLYAVIARCPHFGGKLASFDASAAKSVPGVHAVFPVAPLPRPLNTAGGVAVVADSTWAAIRGRQALKVTWDKGPDGDESMASLRRQIQNLANGPPTYVAVNQGDALKALTSAAKKVEASYELGFQAHATMEPMNTTIHVRDDGIEVWTPTQWADTVLGTVAELSKIQPGKITVHMTLSGGSFGRRAQWDYAAEAWQVGNEVKQPVQLLWTREDDIQHGFYRQYSYHQMAGALDGQGHITAWSHRVISTPISAYFEPPDSLKDPKKVASNELGGATVLPWAVPNFRLDFSPLQSAVPRAWWRSVENSYTGFALQCFVDELAHAAGRDPYEFQMALLDEQLRKPGPNAPAAPDQPPLDARKYQGVLKLAAEKSGWGKPLPAGHGRGIACHYSFDSYIAHVAEVSVDKNGVVSVHRVVSAVDCGTAVHPDGVRSQTEGAINYALTAALTGEITIKDAAVEQSNFNDYQVLRINQSPQIEVHIVPSTEKPTGMGEPAVPPLGPAVANAVFAATGVRVRRLPIDPQIFKGARANA